jgi:hypothetical protein
MIDSKVEWHRVNRHRTCEICDHADWCTYSDLGACCMRIESQRPMRNGGWLHLARSSKVEQPLYKRQVAGSTPAAPTVDFKKLIDRWRKEKAGELEPFAATLGVHQQDLVDLHACWAPDYHAFAFPMFAADGSVVGIRLRNEQFKWSVKGSHPGLFIPFSAVRRVPLDMVLITEGPTDTAAALAIGCFAIGRPSCRGCEEMIVDVLRQIGVREIVVVYDNDEHIDKRGRKIRPGPEGAERLARVIPFRVSGFVPPTKDLREFVTIGGTRELLLSVIRNNFKT